MIKNEKCEPNVLSIDFRLLAARFQFLSNQFVFFLDQPYAARFLLLNI